VPAQNIPVRVLTILVRFGTEQYEHSEREIDEIFERQMPGVDRTVLVVDNALPGGFVDDGGKRVLIGGDNSAREFSGFDQAIQFIGSAIWRYDLVHFATSAFNTLYTSYLSRFTTRLVEAVVDRAVCIGHIDAYNEAVQILGFRTQHWVRSCFFFLSPADVRGLGSFVTIRGGSDFFSGDPQAPFRPDAALSGAYRRYIVEWLTGGDLGQGVVWHSSFALTTETRCAFEHKAVSIMNENLLGVRLRAMRCRLIDVTWLSTMLSRGALTSVQWDTSWQQQLAHRDRDALVFP